MKPHVPTLLTTVFVVLIVLVLYHMIGKKK